MRYIGNKNKILSYIESLINDKNINKENYTFCDAFSGTATVGNYFKDKFKIIANDNLYTSFVMSNARLNTPDLKFEKLGKDPFEIFNDENNKLHGFIYNNFSPGGSERQYFSEDNAARIDYIRTRIEKWYNEDKITRNEYYYLIACLIESVSKVANVAGVYGSYLKMWDPRAVKPMQFIHVEQLKETALYENEIYNKNIEELINDISGDILYLDPPYTKNQYSVQYHLLETIALYDEPELKGKTGARDNSSKTSKFSKPGEVHIEFEKIIAKANFKYIILSYSSDGIMSKEYIESVMKRYGKPDTFEFRKFTYKQYLNSKAEKDEKHCEYLFYIEKKDKDEEVNYSSPLNYIGGKADMISFLKDNAPKNIDRIIDIFGGGFNVGINFDADQIIYNDCNFKVKELLEMLRNTETLDLYKYISSMIKKYKLEKGKKEPYLKIRELYNNQPKDNRDPRLLYLLILFGYQQQIRFNSSYDYNNPVGQAGFNDKILEKLISYCRNLKEKNVVFMSKDFDDMWEHINENTFIYLDPPYLITLGSYNDGKRGFNGWTEKDEIKLLEFLSKINKMGVKFMLSNVLEHKEKKNELLIKWINDNGFRVIEYTEKARKSRKEVIIVNYDKEDYND